MRQIEQTGETTAHVFSANRRGGLLVLLGQGLLTMVIGQCLMDFPGKRKGLDWLEEKRAIQQGLNWIRSKRGKEGGHRD